MKLSNEIKTGIVTVAAIALFIYGLNFLKGRDLFEKQRYYYAIYNNVDGLVEANPVQLNGYKIGLIREIKFLPDNSGKIIVKFAITNDEIKVPKNSVAKIISSDLLGSKAITLIMSNNPELALGGDTLVSELQAGLSEEVNKQVKPLKDKAEHLISSIDSVMVVVQEVLNKDARESLTASFESIKNSIQTFEHTSRMLDTMIASEKIKLSIIFSKVESITSNLEKNNSNITRAINNLANITDTLVKSNLKETIASTNRAVTAAADAMDKINKGEGTAGLLVNDKRLYNQLDSASSALTSLLQDMEKYPGRYFSIFGKKEKPPKKKK